MDNMKNVALFLLVCQLFFLQTSASCPSSCHCERKVGEFEKPSSGTFLNCTESGLKDIAALNPDTSIISLTASHNNFSRLTNTSFSNSHFANIQQIELISNHISHIEVGVFHGLNHLRVVDLDGNDLTEIPSNLFVSNKHLSFLTLKSNPHLVLPEGSWNIPSLIWLDISECGLKTIPHEFFKLMTKLEFIYLSKNELSQIEPPTILSIAPTLTTLDLHGNKFTTIQDEIVTSLPTSCVVDLYDNPFHCNCEFQRAYELLKRRGPVTVQLRCDTPENLHRTRGDDVAAALKCGGTKPANQ